MLYVREDTPLKFKCNHGTDSDTDHFSLRSAIYSHKQTPNGIIAQNPKTFDD